jgi:hypothetical protein
VNLCRILRREKPILLGALGCVDFCLCCLWDLLLLVNPNFFLESLFGSMGFPDLGFSMTMGFEIVYRCGYAGWLPCSFVGSVG